MHVRIFVQMCCTVWYQVLRKENQSGQLMKSRKRVTDSGEFYLEGGERQSGVLTTTCRERNVLFWSTIRGCLFASLFSFTVRAGPCETKRTFMWNRQIYGHRKNLTKTTVPMNSLLSLLGSLLNHFVVYRINYGRTIKEYWAVKVYLANLGSVKSFVRKNENAQKRWAVVHSTLDLPRRSTTFQKLSELGIVWNLLSNESCRYCLVLESERFFSFISFVDDRWSCYSL